MGEWFGNPLMSTILSLCHPMGFYVTLVTSFIGRNRSHLNHDDVIKWKHFPRYWPSVRGSHRSPVNSPHKGQWCGALMFSLICAWINGWVNNREAGDLRRHRAYYDVIVMSWYQFVIGTSVTPISNNVLFHYNDVVLTVYKTDCGHTTI